MLSQKMMGTEKKAIASLAAIMSLRMIALFMVLPVFTLYAPHLENATPLRIGLAMGIYGLAQALFQIPFGVLSDHFGRKPIILMGLLLFAAGSLVAAMAHTITLMTVGRALQGAGAIGSTILAMMADLTREEQRTKAMAIMGITIGLSFSIAMLLGPLLTTWLDINGLFFLAVTFSLLGIFILYAIVPTPQTLGWQRDTAPELKSFLALLITPELAKLNSGIFILHAIFTASFIAIPISLDHFISLSQNRQWLLYLPTLIAALVITLFCIGIAERKNQLKPYFLAGIVLLTVGEIFLWMTPVNRMLAGLGLCLFFAGFSLLEAFLPSLISRTAPASRKGSALGIYSCAQFSGIFVGGVLGGWLYGQFSFAGVYAFCIILACFWLALAFLMQPPHYLITQTLRFNHTQPDWEKIAARLHVIPGMLEVTFIAEDGLVYLKMERETAKHPDFIRLKEHIIAFTR